MAAVPRTALGGSRLLKLTLRHRCRWVIDKTTFSQRWLDSYFLAGIRLVFLLK
jgi:hypothetical protein